MTSREQFEAWFPKMVNGMPDGMIEVFDKMLFTAWQASRSSIELKLTSEWDTSSDGSRHYDADSVDEQLLALGIKVKK